MNSPTGDTRTIASLPTVDAKAADRDSVDDALLVDDRRSLDDAPPLLVYDGDCAFCRECILDWRHRTKDRLPSAAYQEVAERFPEVSREQFTRSVVLIEPDGNIRTGAAAILRSFSYLPRKGLSWWAYRKVPGFRWASEKVYTWVSRHRGALGRYLGHGECDAQSCAESSCATCTSCDCANKIER